MNDIKKREKIEKQIKKIDKSRIYTQKLKRNMINIKEKAKYNFNNNEEDSTIEYGSNKIIDNASNIVRKGTNTFNKYGKKSVEETKINIEKSVEKIRDIKKKINDKKKIKKQAKIIKEKNNKAIKTTNKNTKRTLKNTPKTAKNVLKKTKQAEKTTVKGLKKAYQVSKSVAKKIAKGIKITIKNTISVVKTIIAITKAMITFLIAGGWIAIFIIVIVCLIGLICSSVFGIFFSSESGVGNTTMSSVISEINMEFANKITEIQNNNEYDEYRITSNRAEWKDILSVYAILMNNGESATDVITLDENKINKLKTIFWKMNNITSNVELESREIETTDADGNNISEIVDKRILHISIESKSIEEMIQEYNFDTEQIKQLAELQKEEYSDLWFNVIYGTNIGDSEIVKVALSQIGNVGGEPYWGATCCSLKRTA